jgi:hypothetical protein
MSEQTTFLSRIGSWFKRRDGGHIAGELPLGGNGHHGPEGHEGNGGNSAPDSNGAAHPSGHAALHGLVEPRGTFLRPWAKRDAAIENLQAGVGALAELMNGIRDHLEKQSSRQDEMLRYLSHLPDALKALPESQRLQGETLKAIHHQMAQQHAEQSRLAEVLEKISAADGQNTRTLDALQDHVETLRQHDQAISENLHSVGAAMAGLGKNTEASAEVLRQLRDNTNQRDGELERVLHRQGTRFTTMLAIGIFLSIAALVAVCILGYLAYKSMGMPR